MACFCFKRFFLGVIFTFILWSGGLLLFIKNLPWIENNPKCESVVVLTGGKRRIPYALEVFEKSGAKEMLISGVEEGVTLSEIIEPDIPDHLAKRIKVGHMAYDTRTNALETHLWMKDKGLERVCVVTHQYHMPRSLLEMRRYISKDRIIALPLAQKLPFWNSVNSFIFLVSEYQKYCIAYLWQKISLMIKEFL